MHTRTAVATASLAVLALLIPAATSSWSLVDVWTPWRVLLVGLSVWALFLGVRRPLEVALLLVAAAPLAFVLLITSEGRLRFSPLPGWLWWLVLAASLFLSSVGTQHRRVVAGALVVALCTGLVFASASRGIGEVWRGYAGPSPTERFASVSDELQAFPSIRGLREGCAVRVSPAHGSLFLNGPFWFAAASATHPGARPVVLWLSTSIAPPVDATYMTIVRYDDMLDAVGGEFSGVFDFEPVDAVFCGPDAWHDDADGQKVARHIAEFVDLGGALVVLDEARRPPLLGDTLAGRSKEAIGHLIDIAEVGDLRAKLSDERAWTPRVRTMFHRAHRVSPMAEGWGSWTLAPAKHGRALILVALYILVLFVLQRVARNDMARGATTALAAAVTTLALWVLAPSVPAAHAEAVVMRLGSNTHAKDVHVVRIYAGPEGFEDRIRADGPGYLRWWGAQVGASGKIRVPPGRVAWLVCERVHRAGPVQTDRALTPAESARAASLLPNGRKNRSLRGVVPSGTPALHLSLVGLKARQGPVVRVD